MKELEKLNPIEIREEQQQKKEIKCIGSQRAVKGLTLYEFNKTTKKIRRAEFKKEDLVLNSLSDKVTLSKKVVVKENCVYVQALNKSNAMRKINKSWTEQQ